MGRVKGFLILLLFIMSLWACEKEKQLCPEETGSLTDTIILNDLQISGDSVKLTWSQLDTIAFAGYLIVRINDKEKLFEPEVYYKIDQSKNVIDIIHDPAITSYTDKEAPFTSYLKYQVVGLLRDYMDYRLVLSNTVEYERDNIKDFELDLFQAIPDLPENKLYLFEKLSGKISVYNLNEMNIASSITTNGIIGYSSMGLYGGVKELYVPANDGWIYIYNGETLEEIDKINVSSASSVVYNNGKLFVSIENYIKVYDRGSKQLINSHITFMYKSRLRVIPNTDTEIIEATIDVGPEQLLYHKFDTDGNLVSYDKIISDWGYPLDEIFRFFPDGTEFITSPLGLIYDTDLNFLKRIPGGNLLFSDYAFNTDASIIYCASISNKSIISYSYPDFNLIKVYKPQGYPHTLFRKDNTLICISRTTKYDSEDEASKFLVEKVEL
jgi:hypothetical protein